MANVLRNRALPKVLIEEGKITDEQRDTLLNIIPEEAPWTLDLSTSVDVWRYSATGITSTELATTIAPDPDGDGASFLIMGYSLSERELWELGEGEWNTWPPESEAGLSFYNHTEVAHNSIVGWHIWDAYSVAAPGEIIIRIVSGSNYNQEGGISDYDGTKIFIGAVQVTDMGGYMDTVPIDYTLNQDQINSLRAYITDIGPKYDYPKVTPKSDFIYGGETNGEQRIYNIDGTIKQDTLNSGSVWQDIDGGSYYSVGKGQVMWVDGVFNYDEAGNDRYRIGMCNKDGTGEKQFFTIKEGTTAHMDVINYKFFTFIGKPFGEDRYAMVTGYNFSTEHPNLYSNLLFNIDKWQVEGICNWSASAPFDYVYDGELGVYEIDLNGTRVRKLNLQDMKNAYPSTIDSSAVLDSTGAVVYASRLYGINDNYLFYKGTNGKAWRYTIAGGAAKEWNFAADHTNMIQLPESQYFLQGSSSQSTFQFVKQDGGSAHVDIFQSLVDGGSIIGADELGLTPVLVTNCVETSEYIEFDWVLFRNKYSGDSSYSTKGVRTRINKNGSSTVADWTPSSSLLGTGYGITLATFNQDTINNSFSNSANTYGYGKYYDYGLQVQHDTLYPTTAFNKASAELVQRQTKYRKAMGKLNEKM